MNWLILDRVRTAGLTWKSVSKSMVFDVFIIHDSIKKLNRKILFFLLRNSARFPNVP